MLVHVLPGVAVGIPDLDHDIPRSDGSNLHVSDAHHVKSEK